jgi:hypothetical protein
MLQNPKANFQKNLGQEVPDSAEVIAVDVESDSGIDAGKRVENVDVNIDAKAVALKKVAVTKAARKKLEEDKSRLAAEEAEHRLAEEQRRKAMQDACT